MDNAIWDLFRLTAFEASLWYNPCQEEMPMRPLWKDMLTAVFLGLILPGLMLNGVSAWRKAPLQQTQPPEGPGRMIRVRTGEAVTEMDLEAYITRVVLGEMPASFEEEALKAQSVAARTYAQKASVTGGKHGDGSVCTDPSCCQGYQAEEGYLSGGGAREAVDKVRKAVQDTAGYVLTYDGTLIEATYFSCSGGATEDALAVWGTDFPYLRSVSSPGEEGAEVYSQTVSFTPEQFQQALGRTLTGSPESWFNFRTYTEGGGVAAMSIGGETYSGTRLRSLLGLRSTAFSVEAGPTKITITTRGYGHRVGLSQYGADAMAISGSDYREILSHYYPGTELTRLGIDESEGLRYHN